MAVLRLGLEYLGGSFKAGMRLFGWQVKGWDDIFLIGSSKVGMRHFVWQFEGWDDTIRVAVLRLG